VEKAVKRQVRCTGCLITVVIRKKDFDVFIEVTPGIDTTRKIRFQNVMVRVMQNKNAEITETVRIEHRNVEYNKSSAYCNVRLKTTTEAYTCEVSLPPKLYVPEDVLKKAKEAIERKELRKRDNFSDIIVTGPIRQSGKIQPSKAIYTKNNIARPYVGGRCSPR